MTLLSPLAPSSASLSHLPADIAGPSTGRDYDLAVRALEPVRSPRDPLHDHARRGRLQRSGTEPPEDRGQKPRETGAAALAPRREPDAKARLPAPPAEEPWPEAAPRRPASAAFLVQVFGQDLGRPQVFIPEHRDAAVRGSEAYRRAGATPPVYSQEPTLFRVAI